MSILLIEHMDQETARTLSLVLASAGIDSRLESNAVGWQIFVEEEAAETSRQHILAYLKENPVKGPKEETDADVPSFFWKAGFTAAFSLWFFHLFSESFHDLLNTNLHGASAKAIQSGELYRCVTALILHVDAAHLIANMAGMLIFFSAVAGLTGGGFAVPIILMAGALGNYINALVHPSGHISIGASTAVFGAVGILAGWRLVDNLYHAGKGFRTWLPVIGGLALLAFMGSSPRTDITAHLFGFMCGILFGAAASLIEKYTDVLDQGFLGYVLGSGLLGLAWAWPLYFR